jgi:hypothetical protein
VEGLQRLRKRVEEIFGWAKMIGGMERARYSGLARTQMAAYLVGTAYNLLPNESPHAGGRATGAPSGGSPPSAARSKRAKGAHDRTTTQSFSSLLDPIVPLTDCT